MHFQQPLSQLDWDKLFTLAMTLIPVATFVAGFFLNDFYRNKYKREDANKIRGLLIFEIGWNGFLLARTRNDLKPDLATQIAVCKRIGDLREEVLAPYLDKITLFENAEMGSILFAYQSIFRLKTRAEEHLDFIRSELIKPNENPVPSKKWEVFQNNTEAVKTGIDVALDALNAATSKLSQGKMDLYKYMELRKFDDKK